jgi:hypothetical protein
MKIIPAPLESKASSHWLFVNVGMSILLWASPILGLGIFLPIGAFFLFRLNHRIRLVAFHSLVFQIFSYLSSYSIDLGCLIWSEDYSCSSVLKEQYLPWMLFFWVGLGFFYLVFEAKTTLKKYGQIPRSVQSFHVIWFPLLVLIFLASWFNISRFTPFVIAIIFLPILEILGYFFWKKIFYKLFSKFSIFYLIESFFLVWFAFTRAVYYFSFLALTGAFFNLSLGLDIETIISSYVQGDLLIYFWLTSLYSASSILGRNQRAMAIFRRLYLSLYVHRSIPNPVSSLESLSFKKKFLYANVRNAIFPGWGHIYLNRYWIGFPILFVFLLSVFFLVISLVYYYDYSRGTSFLGFFGLKPGIPDKEFIRHTSSPVVYLAILGIIAFIYILSFTLLKDALKRDLEPESERGLSVGFNNNLALSLLFHFILFSVILLIPITVNRGSNKKQDISKTHFQPEKLEFYFIDPEIPDEVKDLNGGVISGTETPSQNEGMKIPDEPVSDEGKVKGYVKRIKGKKLPKTYSNYISARMRGPELFMDYWKRAPKPYSCVVAYTITTEGEITDVYIVEASAYPDQDSLTIELIESMSPVMPPPGVKGDVRVTELFWNGSIDPDSMPTPLQKEMVLMFDGRYMEEEP